jgi:Tfp pilus assembly protein PilN
MTTTLMPPVAAVPADHALRTLTIAANLLPVEIVESRRGRKVRRVVLAALLVFTALLLAWYGLATHQTSVARDSLTSTEDAARVLLHKQQDFAEVVSTQAESQSIRTQLSVLLADDLRWSRLLSAVQRAEPPGVQLTGISTALTIQSNGPGGAASTKAQLPSTTSEKSVGTITLTGVGTGKAAVAAYVDALAKVPHLANPMLGGATLQDGAVHFTVQVDVTASALGGRYSAADNSGGDTSGGGN